MINLQQATERICELKGSLVALDALTGALMDHLPAAEREKFAATFDGFAEAARTVMLNAEISDHTIAAFEEDVGRFARLAHATEPTRARARGHDAVEPLLLACAPVATYQGARRLTGASGFYFQRDERLFFVTSRHVLLDAPSDHHPDRIELTMHGATAAQPGPIILSLLLYRDGVANWHQGTDPAGEVDVAVIEIERDMLGGLTPYVFTRVHLQQTLDEVDVGTPLLVVGFPLGFHDDVNHLPVARQATIASSFGTRFQGQGVFVTDGRMHRGSSGAPVVMRDPDAGMAVALPWKLLGIHSSRLDMRDRDNVADESLGLNFAWYADILLTLTA